ncbi:glycosyltransferase family 88 protein [Legionella qingyii]|uniref:glycosyltransferase family 88 protein n=1 Tax=Legionella qingyii TaxID=2184757 RepID=UPI000F8E064B|nr:glycosyltransferase family 88 protein [Legionella qingyii]RUR22685.1 hypothetical protein ELY16_14405 [Legionella qingyii]
MRYQFNPHRHVKIWLSQDRNSFLNLENQKRLIKMRYLNPDDEIHFVYDSRLLNPKAQEDLKQFCNKHHITPMDVATLKGNNETEHQLLEHYSNEIKCLGRGGNLAVASDILRWIEDIYKLGTYADFDTRIDTRGLPALIEVEHPLLLSMGSIKIASSESLVINNDIIAVVDPNDALPYVKKVQDTILKNLTTKHRLFSSYFDQVRRLYNSVLGDEVGGLFLSLSAGNELQISEELDQLRASTNSMPELRFKIEQQYKDNQSFCRKKNTNVVDCAQEIRKSAASWLVWLITPKAIYQELKKLAAIKNDEELVSKVRQNQRLQLLKSSVVYTTGPGALLNGLFSQYLLSDSNTIKQDKINTFAFSHYGLEKRFISKNYIPFASSLKTVNALQNEGTIGKCNDLSWLKEGQEAIHSREEIIRKKQGHLKIILPQELGKLKQLITKHIAKLDRDLHSPFRFYRAHARMQKLGVLKDILNLFNENYFDKEQLNMIMQKYSSEDIFASIGTSRTQTLIKEITRFAKKAEVYQLDEEDGRIAYKV